MKKSALLASVLVLYAANAWAYENPAAGFSVRDKDPFYKMESSKLYAFSSFSTSEFAKLENKDMGSIHVINYYTGADMGKILGVNYNDAYFAAEYEKLALLERSKLDLRTVPSPLLDLKKYALLDDKGSILLQDDFLKQQLAKIEPTVRIDKIGQYKVITQSYLYKQDNTLNELDISLVAAHNSLYLLTSITTDSKYYAQKAEAVAEKSKNSTANEDNLSSKALSKDLQIEKVQLKTLPLSLRKSLWQEHVKLVKGFKTFQPKQSKQELQFVDSYKGKTVVLPQDWVYGQLQIKDKQGQGCLTMAAPVQNLRRIFAEMDYLGLYQSLEGSSKLPVFNTEVPPATKPEARKVLKNLNAFLLTLSYQTKDKDFQAMTEAALASKLGADALLSDSLNFLKNHSGETFALEKYTYKLDFTPNKVLATIQGRTKLLQEFQYDNFMQIALLKNSGSVLLYAHKPEENTSTELEQSLREWDF